MHFDSMNLLAITGVLLGLVVILQAVTDILNGKKLKELEELCDRRDEALRTALTNMAGTTAELKEKLDELPLDELSEEYRNLKNWNDGVQSILNFGPDVPRLNKEVLKHE